MNPISGEIEFDGDNLTYIPSPGEHINKAVKALADITTDYNLQGRMEFNEIAIRAHPGDNPDDLVEYYYKESHARHEAWKNSPEGIKEEKEHEERILSQQKRVHYLIDNLPDFSNLESVISWLEEVEKCDSIDISNYGIVELFMDHGFYPNVNLEENFHADDKENVARYLIGQALNFILTMGTIHQIYHTFSEKWKEKFVKGDYK